MKNIYLIAKKGPVIPFIEILSIDEVITLKQSKNKVFFHLTLDDELDFSVEISYGKIKRIYKNYFIIIPGENSFVELDFENIGDYVNVTQKVVLCDDLYIPIVEKYQHVDLYKKNGVFLKSVVWNTSDIRENYVVSQNSDKKFILRDEDKTFS